MTSALIHSSALLSSMLMQSGQRHTKSLVLHARACMHAASNATEATTTMEMLLLAMRLLISIILLARGASGK